MNAVPIQTCHLLEVDPTDKLHLPVSIAIDANREHTVISRYEEDVWNFWPYIVRENAKDGEKRIIWSIALPDGSKLTDEKNRSLLMAAKDFIWSLHVDPIEGIKRPGMKTLIGMMGSLIFLLRWMNKKGIDRFADLAGKTMDYVVAARDGGRCAKTTVMKRLLLVEKLHAQAGKIADALPVHPWPFESATVLAGVDQRMAHRTPKTRLIPDSVFVELARRVIEYVDDRAEAIITVHEQAEAAIQHARADGLTDNYSFVFGTKVAQTHGYEGLRELNIEMSMLKTACYICINMFSGLRNSEMMSLESGCLSREPSHDGSYECIWLHGTIYKTGQRPHRWLVPPIVERAVRVAERLISQHQDNLHAEEQKLCSADPTDIRRSKRLAEIRRNRKKLFLSTHYSADGPVAVVPGNAVVNRSWLKDFCRHLNITDETGKVWDLASHQFRRTFAYYYARSELGDLLYLKEHFGHWSLDMTLLYADGGTDEYQLDNGLLEEVMRAKQERQTQILTAYLTSDAPLANGEDWLGAWKPMVRTAKNKEALIEELSGTITLNGTGHSWCAGNAKGGSCGGLCLFEADMCVDCNTALIGPEHLPVWHAIAEQQRAVLDLADLGVPAKSRANRILQKANTVIAKLEAGAGR